MAEASLVMAAIESAKDLNLHVEQVLDSQVLRSLLVDDYGDWRLAVVVENLRGRGRLELARRLYQDSDPIRSTPFDDLSRVILLDVDDPDSLTLLLAMRSDFASYGPSLWIGDFHASSARMLWKSSKAVVRFHESALTEIESAFLAEGFTVERDHRTDIGWMADLRVSASDRSILVELVNADRRSWKSRLRDAAGVANLASIPIVLVIRSLQRLPGDMRQPLGSVPVVTVDWEEDGGAAAVVEAGRRFL